MQPITVLGCGKIGKQVVMELLEDGFKVLVIDQSPEPLEFKDNENVKYLQEILQLQTLDDLIRPRDLVVLALPGSISYPYLERLIQLQADVVDVTFMPEDPLPLRKLAEANGCSVVVDFGVAPGMCGAIVGFENNTTSTQIQNVEIFVGGVPVHPKYPHYYFTTFSPGDVVDEYIRPVRFRYNGEDLVLNNPLETSGVFNGELSYFPTDGLRTLLHSYKHIPNMSEYTLRHPQHLMFMEFLGDSGFLQPDSIEHTRKKLIEGWTKQSIDLDKTIMEVIVEYDDYRIIWDLTEYETNGVPSMSKVTACATTSVVNLMAQGKIELGLNLPEEVGEKHLLEILDYMENKNIIYDRTEEDLDEYHNDDYGV